MQTIAGRVIHPKSRHWVFVFDVFGRNRGPHEDEIIVEISAMQDFAHWTFAQTYCSQQFVFIGTDFKGKGGIEICAAFQKIYQIDPEYKLIIIGQKPPDEFLRAPGITYVGYINKSTDEGRKQFSEIYRKSRALLMLTKKDIFPIVLIEAGLHGCPAIANMQSGIPEVILDDKTGYLIENSSSSLEIAMQKLVEQNEEELMKMRQFTSAFYAKNYSWEEIYCRIHSSMKISGVFQ